MDRKYNRGKNCGRYSGVLNEDTAPPVNMRDRGVEAIDQKKEREAMQGVDFRNKTCFA